MHSRRTDPFAAMCYGIAAVLLAVYLVTAALSRSSAPITPLLRIALLLLTCLSAFLGARVPRLNEKPDPALLRRRVRRVMWLCFFLYLHLVLTFTLFDPGFGREFFSIFQASPADRTYYMEWYVNLTPMHTVNKIYLSGWRNGLIGLRYLLLNLAGNLFVLVPLAFFLPYLWRRVDRFWRFALLTLAFAILIELCQLAAMCGSCDIDDVILNVGGALPFWFILRIPPLRRWIDRLTLMTRQTKG